MIGFRAYSKHGSVTAMTAKDAALQYFQSFPTSRKCDIVQGFFEGFSFVVKYGRVSQGQWPESYKDVTKKTLDNLPDIDKNIKTETTKEL